MFDGVSYGLLAGLTICGLVLLLIFGSKMHGYYALTCACALAALGGLNEPVPLTQWPAAALVLWTACRLQFGRQLLRLEDFAPRLDRIARASLIVFAVATLYAALETQRLWSLRAVQALAVASTVILAAGAVKVLRRLPWPAALFLAGVALLLGGLWATPLSMWLTPAWAQPQRELAQAAVIAELLVFVLALGMRQRTDGAAAAHTQQKAGNLDTDPLTGAASRAGFESRAGEWLRYGRPFSLMLIDLHGFKAVNERHGRAGGDAVLAAIAQRLREQVRADDMVARLGGDEFAILLVGTPPRQKLAEMAIRIETAGARPVAYEGRVLAGGELSMGIACRPADADTLDSLLESAGRALRHCKRQRMGPAYAFAAELAGGAASRE